MRPYLPVITVVAVFILIAAAGYMGATVFEAPADKFDREVGQKIEEAQRMLAEYEASGTQLLAGLAYPAAGGNGESPVTEPTTQPIEPRAEEPDPLAGFEPPPVPHELSDRFERLGGERSGGRGGLGVEELRAKLEANQQLLSNALQAVREALRMSDDSGEGLNARQHPTGTRLEAILIYHQADLNRRQGALDGMVAANAQDRFGETMRYWRQADTRVTSLQRELSGFKGGPNGVAPAAPSASAPVEAAEGSPDVGQPSDGRTEIVPVGDVSSLSDRISALRAAVGQAGGEVETARKEVERLKKDIEALQARATQVKSEADSAERRMMALEDAGVEPADPKDLERFIGEFTKAAETQRQMSRELSALESGTIRNARPDTRDEDQILTAPMAPADRAHPMTPEVGLVWLKEELRAAEALQETREQLQKAIQQQIDDLSQRQKIVTEQLAKAKEWRSKLQDQVLAHAKEAVAAALKAYQDEQEAIRLINEEGLNAAQIAAQAASEQVRAVGEFYRNKAPTAPAPQVRFLSGHAQTATGDLKYELAMIYGQRARGLEKLQKLLEGALAAGIQPATLLPEGEMPEGDYLWATDAQAAGKEAAAARAEAVKSAQEALEAYQEADDMLGQLWVLHTHMGAVNYLLAGLTTGEEAQKYREQARTEYQRAVRDRSDRPEAQVYQPIIEALSAAQPAS
ncbi:MAG: hypothetical protein AMXMBFR13_36000 [Phycisphaerae bacterium]